MSVALEADIIFTSLDENFQNYSLERKVHMQDLRDCLLSASSQIQIIFL